MPQTADQPHASPGTASVALPADAPPPSRPSPWTDAAERRAYYAEASEAAMASPARAMQRTLGAEFDARGDEQRWPLRRSVALVFTTCGAFWVAVYLLLAALVG